MKNAIFHVAPNDGEWTVNNDEIGPASLIFDSKDEALDRVKNLAEDDQLKVLILDDQGFVQDEIQFVK